MKKWELNEIIERLKLRIELLNQENDKIKSLYFADVTRERKRVQMVLDKYCSVEVCNGCEGYGYHKRKDFVTYDTVQVKCEECEGKGVIQKY